MIETSYLFDTGAVIDIFHGRARVRSFFDGLISGAAMAYVSPLTEAELWLGLRPNEQVRHEALLSLFITLPLTSPAARLAGEWMRRDRSKQLGWIDALIVATAALAALPVLTRDRQLASLLAQDVEFKVYDEL
jgi:predicted nucleic acid-binding protein